MEHKIKSKTSPFKLEVYNHNEFTQIRVESDITNGQEYSQMFLDIKPKELRQFIECLELLEKQIE